MSSKYGGLLNDRKKNNNNDNKRLVKTSDYAFITIKVLLDVYFNQINISIFFMELQFLSVMVWTKPMHQ